MAPPAIKTVCKSTVVSTKPVQPGKFYEPPALGRVMEGSHLRMVYYYSAPKDGEVGERTKRLRESISEMLSSYPVVTGRLVKNEEGRWRVKCNDAGVRVVEATAEGGVEEWLRRRGRAEEMKLVHWEDMFHKPYFWSTFYVQLTEFEEGGLTIGLSCTHLLADPISATMFIKAWADVTHGCKILSPPLFHPLPPRIPANTATQKAHSDLINHYKSYAQNKPAAPSITATKQETLTLSFTDEMVHSCMAMAAGARAGENPTPFEALAALFWVCVSKAKREANGLIPMSLCMDMRKTLHLEKGIFGNCMAYSKVNGAGLDEKGLEKPAMAVREKVKKMGNKEGAMDLVEWLELGIADYDHHQMNGCDLICADFEDVEPYSAVFEEGLDQVHVSCYTEPVTGLGQVLILPSPQGKFSRVAMVTLAEDEAAKLCEDELLLHFNPTVSMGASKY